jgi:hypothetical protein
VISCPRQGVRASRSRRLRKVNVNLAHAATRDGNADHVVNYSVLLRLQFGVHTFLSQAATTVIHTQLLKLQDLGRGIATGKVDRYSTNLLGFGKPCLDMIDDIDARCTPEKRTVCAEKADGSGAE